VVDKIDFLKVGNDDILVPKPFEEKNLKLEVESIEKTKNTLANEPFKGGPTFIIEDTSKNESEEDEGIFKYELEEEAKVWAAYRTARHVITQTVEKYKNEHLPRMLAKAEEFLHFLTDGNYVRMIPKEAGTGFLIQRNDQTYFEANELSQATTEQVYVSLRLALTVTLYEQYKLPIIIDDSFVNFDKLRTSKIMKLLKEFSHHQVFFFTCHEHMLEYFHEEDILKLEKGKASVG